jgi:hypothetical protein
MYHALEGWYDALLLLPFLLDNEKLTVYVVGDRIDAETCDRFATRED